MNNPCAFFVLCIFFSFLWHAFPEREEEKTMKEEKCILCGRAFPTGLHILGCLICFPCEKQMLSGLPIKRKRRRLCRIYEGRRA